ncbi:MAG: ACT domain-containing protein [Tissierellia bacterium]|nr:ACT domain-containing protein [Tissierellia bacterium]
MYVKNYMLKKEDVFIADLEDSLESALKEMGQNDFLSLPAFSDGVLKGHIMKETIYRGFIEEDYQNFHEYLQSKKVKDIYDGKIHMIYEDDEIEKASYLLSKIRIPFLAVINSNNDFAGILTHRAIFDAFSSVIGLEKGYKIVVDMLNKPGQLAKFTELLTKENANILNITIIGHTDDGRQRNIIRIETEDIDDLLKKIADVGFRIV